MKNINEIKQGDLIWFNTNGIKYVYKAWNDDHEENTYTGNDPFTFIKVEVRNNKQYLCFWSEVNEEKYFMYSVSDLVEKGYLELEKPIPLKEGMWVWARFGNGENNKYLVKFKQVINEKKTLVSVWISDMFNTYNDDEDDTFEEILGIATEAEIRNSLIRVAAAKGYTPGKKFKSTNGAHEVYTMQEYNDLQYKINLDRLGFFPGTIYWKGKWAELVEENIEELNF